MDEIVIWLVHSCNVIAMNNGAGHPLFCFTSDFCIFRFNIYVVLNCTGLALSAFFPPLLGLVWNKEIFFLFLCFSMKTNQFLWNSCAIPTDQLFCFLAQRIEAHIPFDQTTQTIDISIFKQLFH
jgi:hypothetical protein